MKKRFHSPEIPPLTKRTCRGYRCSVSRLTRAKTRQRLGSFYELTLITLRRQRKSLGDRAPGWVECRLLDIIEMAATRRRLRDGILSVGCIGTIVGGMAAIDETIRGSLVSLFRGNLSTVAFLNELTVPMLRAQHVVQMFSNSVGLSNGNHAVLMGFGLGTIVLFVLMLRS